MSLLIQSWMLPVFFMVIGLLLLVRSKSPEQSLTGVILIVFGFGMQVGGFLP